MGKSYTEGESCMVGDATDDPALSLKIKSLLPRWEAHFF